MPDAAWRAVDYGKAQTVTTVVGLSRLDRVHDSSRVVPELALADLLHTATVASRSPWRYAWTTG
jgi:hypothetical protein